MEKRSCIVCQNEAPHLCSGCKNVRYCSKEHQKMHWNQHKLICHCYRLECSPVEEEGQYHYVVANMDIKAGTIILKEDPLVVGPIQSEEPVCVGCCRPLDGQGVGCPTCNWPMCGRSDCWGKGSHHQLGECAFLEAAGGSLTHNYSLCRTTKGVNLAIMILRYLSLQKKDPAKYRKFMHLTFDSIDRVFENVDKVAVVNMVKRIAPGVSVTEEWILGFCGIFLIKGHDLHAITDERFDGLRAFFTEASLIGHCCVPNATASFSKTGQIVVRAAVPIAKGSNICLNYTKSPFWGTLQRQVILEDYRLISICRCQRCKDPTELNTFTSGIYCQKCTNQTGILLFENPLKMDSYWVCNSCSDRKPFPFILDILKRSKFVSTVDPSIGTLDQSIAELEDFIRKNTNILHPNHSLMTEVKLILYKLYTVYDSRRGVGGEALPGRGRVNLEQMNKKEALLLDLLEIVDVISPGLNKARGKLLFHLAEIKFIRHEEMCLPNEAFVKSKLHESHLKKVHAMMKEACTILSWYPEMKTAHDNATLRLSLIESYLRHISSELAVAQ